MPPAGFKPVISAGDWPQTHTLDSAPTGTGENRILKVKNAKFGAYSRSMDNPF